jgi:hypothetical protein
VRWQKAQNGARTPNNHSKDRKKSMRENRNRQMVVANRCWVDGHKATGYNCRAMAAYGPNMIRWSDVPEIVKRLGRPAMSSSRERRQDGRFTNGFFLGVRRRYRQKLVIWYNWIPTTAPCQSRYSRWIEVTVLGERGKELTGWEKASFSAHEIGEWLEKNCASKQRGKRCLST